MTSQDALADRYGTTPPWQRRALVGLVTVLAAASAAWLVWALLFHADPDVSGELLGFEVVDEHTVTAEVSVERSDDDLVATCRLRAIAEDQTTVGELSWTPEGEARGREELTIRTERRATAVELLGCTTPDQPRPR